MKIGTRAIGPGRPPYVIAEIGVNHDGEVARALELTQAAAEADADAVKLQYFETDRLLSKAAKLAAYQKAAGETDPVAMLRRLELSLDEMAQVVDLAHELGIHAIVTVFSVELVKPASELAWDAYKSASPDVINRPLLKMLAATGKPLIVSTGASTLDEVVRAVGWLEAIRGRLAVLQCVSSYPATEPAFGGIPKVAESTGVLTGYSDHTPEIESGYHAVSWGATLLEKHITYDRLAAGPDHNASIVGVGELAEYVLQCRMGLDAADAISAVRAGDDGYGLDPFKLAESMLQVEQTRVEKLVLPVEQDVRTVSRQSLTTTRDKAPGDVITRDDLTIKRPGTGLEPFRLDEIVGKRLARGVEADTPLTEDDLA